MDNYDYVALANEVVRQGVDLLEHLTNGRKAHLLYLNWERTDVLCLRTLVS